MKILICLIFLFLMVINSLMAANQQKPQSASVPAVPIRIGVGTAVEYMSAEATIKIKPGGSLGEVTASNQSHIVKKLQIAPCLEIGATFYDDYYLGLHLSWRHSGAKNTSRSPLKVQYYFTHEFKLNSYGNALFKPGYRLTPQIMIYGLIGPSIANWSHTTQQFYVDGSGLRQESSLVDQKRITRKSIGLGLGLGFEYLLQKKYALSFDYTYYAHRSKTESENINYVEETAVIGPGRPNRVRARSGTIVKTIRPSYSTFAVRFTYFFSIP